MAIKYEKECHNLRQLNYEARGPLPPPVRPPFLVFIIKEVPPLREQEQSWIPEDNYAKYRTDSPSITESSLNKFINTMFLWCNLYAITP